MSGCGVCLTCDPPQDDPRFGFPLMQRMYVCGTCGNKRCPAAGDCLKWECSGSNATNQVPVPRTREGKQARGVLLGRADFISKGLDRADRVDAEDGGR